MIIFNMNLNACHT